MKYNILVEFTRSISFPQEYVNKHLQCILMSRKTNTLAAKGLIVGTLLIIEKWTSKFVHKEKEDNC